MQLQYICDRIKKLANDLRDAKKVDDQEAAEHDLRILRKTVRALTQDIKASHEDGAFFEHELEEKEEPKQTKGAHTKEEKEDSCDAVDAFRKRRRARTDARCVERFRKRRQDRLDAKDDEEGRWVTTENNHKIHISEEGEPDKGNPHVIEKMESGSGDQEQKKASKMNGDSLKKMMDKSYGDVEAYNRGRFANEDREQYRFFGGYMHGVGYGSKSHEAFNQYNYHGDTLINGMLRGSKPKRMSQQKEWEDNKEKTKEYIDQMTEAIDKNPLRKSACVYRGIEKKGTLSKMLGLKLPDGTDIESLYGDKDFMESLVGRTFSDPGFTSTSIDPDFPSRGGFNKACSMEIYCPEGTKGTYFGDALRITDESEYLLQRGTQFVVTGVEVEDKPYNMGKRLKLKVAVIGQEPQEIPELKTLYKPNERITEAIEKEEEIPEKELKSMYSGLSKGALKDIVAARKGPKDQAFYAIDDILMEEAFAGNITPEQAGEIEAYAMRIKDIGSRIDPHRSQYGRKLSDGNSAYEPSEDTISKVKKKYPDIPDDLAERIATMRTIAKEHVTRGKRDLKRYGEDSIATHLLESAKEYKKAETYAIRAYRAAKERTSA